MKKLTFLRAILDIYWFVSIIFILSLLVVVIRFFFNDDFNSTLQIRGLRIDTHSNISKIVVLTNVVSTVLLVYGIYLLRKVFILFQKKEVFTSTAINCFRKIGKCILASAVLSQGSIIFYNQFEQNAVGNSIGFDTFLFAASSGIIFIVLSEIFKIAKQQKEENDLTI